MSTLDELFIVGGSGLQAAARGGHRIIVERLVDKSADVNASRGLCRTPLQAAARAGHKMIVQLLISRGADINAQGGLYGTTLQAAVTGSYEDITILLIEKGANIHAQGGFYGSILEAVTQTRHPRIAQLLHEKGLTDVQVRHRHTGHGSSFQKSISTSEDRGVDGNDLLICAELAAFDDGVDDVCPPAR